MLNTLDPSFKSKVENLLTTWLFNGISYNIVDASRSFATQNAAYQSGRPGVVPPEESWHVKKKAIDVEFKSKEYREKARNIAKGLGFYVIDEDKFGYTHLHIDGRYFDFCQPKEQNPPQIKIQSNNKKKWVKIGLVAGFLISAWLIYRKHTKTQQEALNDGGGPFAIWYDKSKRFRPIKRI